MSHLKAIIFDWDNTIVNSFDHLVFFHREVAQQLGWPLVTDEQIKKVWGMPFEGLIQSLWPMHDSNDYDIAYRRYILEQTIPEVEGAVDTIVRLKGLYLLGIITAAPRYEVEHFMTHLGLDKADFFIFQAAGESEYHKPDPRVFDSLIASLQQHNNIGRSEILYVGDSLSDFYAARDAHLQFIAVLTGATTREQFQTAGVSGENILNSIIELLERLILQ